MTTLGTIKLSKIIKLIEKQGYQKIRQKGSHATYAKNGAYSITIAMNQKDARRYTLKDVMDALNITTDELKQLIQNQ
ncbi:MAG: type II toxin-antitoxin system HicA family toxin [Elusimicrobiota bacterium]|jgi:predicted RNA binding protein YcfA (HicA-like mRNA interferase family)|nr:type II toxin-antitoxin system HicA family toxin [Elusimicrobiota bacterium]